MKILMPILFAIILLIPITSLGQITIEYTYNESLKETQEHPSKSIEVSTFMRDLNINLLSGRFNAKVAEYYIDSVQTFDDDLIFYVMDRLTREKIKVFIINDQLTTVAEVYKPSSGYHAIYKGNVRIIRNDMFKD